MDTTTEKINVITNLFDEKRTIIPEVLEENLNGDGEVFKTQNGEIIYFELQLDNFNIDELIRYTGIMETLYSKYKVHCTACILCADGVEVQVCEMPIKSEADFTIKLAQSDMNPCDVVLDVIKTKMRNGELLDEGDIHALQVLPMMCSKDKRDYYRKKVFAIMNEIGL